MIKSRTKKEALQHILDCFDADKLGASKDCGCLYKEGDRNCGIGCLFTEAQLQWLIDNNLNTFGIEDVIEKVGFNNIHHMTGMNELELSGVQICHDVWAEMGTPIDSHSGKEFRKEIVDMLNKATD